MQDPGGLDPGGPDPIVHGPGGLGALPFLCAGLLALLPCQPSFGEDRQLELAPAPLPLVPPTPPPPLAPTVALMDQQRARPLLGRFNSVPVLHSNQPEQVLGPGILVDTRPGQALDERGLPLANATYRFQGPFGVHLHHKYAISASNITDQGRRLELVLGVVLTNPGPRPVTVQLLRGALRNSFAAPYLGNRLLGVKPLGPRAWNTGPGDATAVAMLRNRLDPSLPGSVTIPARGRLLLLQERLPAQGMLNGLLRGESDGPFHITVVAAPDGAGEAELLAVADSGLLAPGREYLSQMDAIHSRQVFSRVSGVAIGDHYQAELSHDLDRAGPLHVPLTSTVRQTFGTGEVQVNRLVSRMADSALDNVGTYGVLFDLSLTLRGSGPQVLVLSHPDAGGAAPFIAFRGSIRLQTPAGEDSLHVGMRSGESLALSPLSPTAGQPLPLRLQLVYPADSTPGHLLSVVPLEQWMRRAIPPATEPPPLAAALPEATPAPARSTPPTSASPAPRPRPAPARRPLPASPVRRPADGTWRPQGNLGRTPVLRPPRAASPSASPRQAGSLVDRYRQALEAQERMMGTWQLP